MEEGCLLLIGLLTTTTDTQYHQENSIKHKENSTKNINVLRKNFWSGKKWLFRKWSRKENFHVLELMLHI